MSWSTDKAADIMSQRGWHVAKTSKVILRDARLIDPSAGLDEIADLLIERGKIEQIGKIKEDNSKDFKVLELNGKIVAPGFFDMHVHLREPGREDKETILTGTMAAAAGGFTGVACMPNTDPPLDNVGVVRWVYEMASGAQVAVHPIAAITKQRKGNEITEISELYQSGVRALSNDGDSVMNSEVMRRALEYSSMHDMVIMTHSEDDDLAGNGVMREGEVSTRLGLTPWPSLAESIHVARDTLLAKFTGGRIHVSHISSLDSIEAVRQGKAQNVNVTSEATPHHFSLTDEACTGYDTNFKMNPPLGTPEDRDAVIEGLKDGTIDTIATDHAPHTTEEKLVEFDRAPFGVVGLETAIGVAAKKLVNPGHLEWKDIVEKMSINPRKIMRLPVVTIKEGAVADLTLIDPECTWTVDPADFFTKGRNTPFTGWDLPARPIGILSRGWILISPAAENVVG